MNETSPHPFKAFPSYLLQTWCTWCISQPPPPTHSALPSLYVYWPMKDLHLPEPLLQQAHNWLLFLGIFGGRRGLEYLVLFLFTHIQEQTVTDWMRESRGERGSVAFLPCILATHSYAFTPLFFCGPLNCPPRLLSYYWSEPPQH